MSVLGCKVRWLVIRKNGKRRAELQQFGEKGEWERVTYHTRPIHWYDKNVLVWNSVSCIKVDISGGGIVTYVWESTPYEAYETIEEMKRNIHPHIKLMWILGEKGRRLEYKEAPGRWHRVPICFKD